MNKQINTALAIAVIIIIAGIAGGAMLLGSKNQSQETNSTIIQPAKKDVSTNTASTVLEDDNNNQKNYCEIIANNKKEPDVETQERKNNKDWNIFVNWRDNYQIDYPADKLSIDGTQFIDSGNGRYWSASIGYPDRLGAFGAVMIYCGDIESAVSAYYKDDKNIQITSKKETLINGKNAIIIYWRDSTYANKPIGEEVVIQYKKDRVLIIEGSIENKSDSDIFDSMLKTLAFIPEIGEN